MIIVNSKKTVVIPTDNVAEVNIHSDGKRIMVKLRQGHQMDIPIATYDSLEKARIAMGQLINAWHTDVFRLPDNDEIDTVIKGNALKGYSKTAGKQK